MNEQDILAFIQEPKLCVLATVNDRGTPESAVVGFSAQEGCKLIIATSDQSRKVRNLTQRPDVSVVIGWDGGKTVQYEGHARVLRKEELDEWLPKHFAKQPMSAKNKDNPHECYVLIEPDWLRFTDLTVHPWATHQVTISSRSATYG